MSITAGTTYVASYYAPVGRYAADEQLLRHAGVDNGAAARADRRHRRANGVYRYGTGGGSRSSSYLSSNYWVDVVFTTP